jgi:hypothetical protein
MISKSINSYATNYEPYLITGHIGKYYTNHLGIPDFIPEYKEILDNDAKICKFKNIKYVKHSEGEISDNISLVSIGFRECSAIIIINKSTNETLLIHHDSGARFLDNGNIREHGRFKYNAFMSKHGEKEVLLISGQYSFNRERLTEKIVEDGATMLPPLYVMSSRRNNTGYDKSEYRWDIVYRPLKKELIITLKDIDNPVVLYFSNIFS